MTNSNNILIKNAEEIKRMEISGRLTGQVLEAVRPIIIPGITTLEIDAFCHDYIVNTLGAIPGSLGQYGFPYTANTSVNHVVCHGWPSDKKLKNSDIVNVDVTVKKDGYYGDSSVTFCVGEVASHAKRLVDVTQECLYKAIKIVKPGITLGDIGQTIQQHAEANNYSVVREYCGHGIGSNMHEEPQILHYGRAGEGVVLEEGMTFTIEPMINQGKKEIKLHKDGWTVTTKDRRLSAQFEHTILVTHDGFKVLTLRDEEREVFERCIYPMDLNIINQ
ncbi:type I methionyl aminopeptidase [Xenorhabdus budapestensis]|uniref:Methionine aminopeptidase n=1 Tax=Xenorhabdus budapestensis TaxID=290110 RepID=A0ABX7VFZ4_XENBU|nr:type I methionyl aminopeptidase [Xenorhabdus budapestensis]QTL39370.1 type I methionyl aminopeptidase [Xenorhabdus budapestensis]